MYRNILKVIPRVKPVLTKISHNPRKAFPFPLVPHPARAQSKIFLKERVPSIQKCVKLPFPKNIQYSPFRYFSNKKEGDNRVKETRWVSFAVVFICQFLWIVYAVCFNEKLITPTFIGLLLLIIISTSI